MIGFKAANDYFRYYLWAGIYPYKISIKVRPAIYDLNHSYLIFSLLKKDKKSPDSKAGAALVWGIKP